MGLSLKRFILIASLAILIIAILLFNNTLLESLTGLSVIIVFLIAWSVLFTIWWRCPNCKRHLGRTLFTASNCQHCGEKLA